MSPKDDSKQAEMNYELRVLEKLRGTQLLHNEPAANLIQLQYLVGVNGQPANFAPGAVQALVSPLATTDLYNSLKDARAGSQSITASTFDAYCSWRVLSQASKGLLFLHTICEPPIAHMDVKALNLLLKMERDKAYKNAMIKICDFGSARLLERGARTPPSNTLGTPNFAAPEVVLASMRRKAAQKALAKSPASPSSSAGVDRQQSVERRPSLGFKQGLDRTPSLNRTASGKSAKNLNLPSSPATARRTSLTPASPQLLQSSSAVAAGADDFMPTTSADIWSFGCVIIEVFGTPSSEDKDKIAQPWSAVTKNFDAVYAAMFAGKPDSACGSLSPQDARPPPELENIFNATAKHLAEKCLKPDPAQRIAIKELEYELGELADKTKSGFGKETLEAMEKAVDEKASEKVAEYNKNWTEKVNKQLDDIEQKIQKGKEEVVARVEDVGVNITKAIDDAVNHTLPRVLSILPKELVVKDDSWRTKLVDYFESFVLDHLRLMMMCEMRVDLNAGVSPSGKQARHLYWHKVENEEGFPLKVPIKVCCLSSKKICSYLFVLLCFLLIFHSKASLKFNSICINKLCCISTSLWRAGYS
jgi:serine/threonine protein kinase